MFDDAVIKAKTDLEDALRDKKDLEAQLDEVLECLISFVRYVSLEMRLSHLK